MNNPVYSVVKMRCLTLEKKRVGQDIVCCRNVTNSVEQGP